MACSGEEIGIWEMLKCPALWFASPLCASVSLHKWFCCCWDHSMQAVLVLLTSTCPLDWDCTVLQQCHPLDTLLEWVHASWSLPRCGYLHAHG